MARLLFDIALNDFMSAKLVELSDKIDRMSAKIEKPHKVKVDTAQAEGGLSSLVGLASRAFAAFGVFEGVKSIITLGANLEQTRIQFETFTGSAEKGNKVIADLQRFAQVTPFDDTEVVNSGRSLLAFGEQASSLMPILTKLGNISSAVPVALQDLVNIYGKNKLSGIIQSDDLNQLNNNGIPVIKSLARQLGVAESGVKKMAESGKISFKMLDTAFDELGGKGGLWGDLMDKQSKSVAGKWSSLVGFAQNLGGKLGEALNPFIGKIVDGGNTLLTFVSEKATQIEMMFKPLTKAFQPIIDAFGFIIEQEYGAGDAASGLAKVFNRVATVIQHLSPLINIAAKLFAQVYLAVYKAEKAIFKFVETSPRLQKFFSGVWSAAVETFRGIAEAVGKYLGGVGSILEGVFSGNFSKIKEGLFATMMAVSDTTRIGEKAADGFVKGYKKGFKRSTLFDVAVNAPGSGTDAATDFMSGKKPGANTTLAPGLSAASAAGAAGASGDSKVTNITLRIGTLINELSVEAANVTEGADRIADIVLKKLMSSLNDVNTMASS